MKIKTDFVTNSSSTSYVLYSIVSGKLNRLSGNYSRLKKIYKNQKFIYDHYAYISVEDEKDPGNPYYASDEKSYKFQIILKDSYTYDEQKQREHQVTLFTMYMYNMNPYNFDQIELTQEIIEKLLFKDLKENIPPSQLIYVACPSDIDGDGWDGGDPSGPSIDYTYRYELYAAESKMGIFTIMNNKLIPEIGDIKNQFSLNQMALDHMNDTGFCLEEQNDKNS